MRIQMRILISCGYHYVETLSAFLAIYEESNCRIRSEKASNAVIPVICSQADEQAVAISVA